MLPIRRDFHFKLDPKLVKSWHAKGPHVSNFLNTLSLFFPEGERFFIHAVRQFRDAVDDPALKAQVTAFIGQEAMHGREHAEYNAMMDAAGLPISRLEGEVTRLLEWFKAHRPARSQLAGTIALEHFTAILADALLQHPEILDGSDARYTALWRWHALEETEHKAVAFDVWKKAMGDGPAAYAIRSAVMIEATAIFVFMVAKDYAAVMRADKDARGFRGYLTLANFLVGRPGILRRVVPAWFAYFKPGFHPWQHDNSHHLTGLDSLMRNLEPPARRKLETRHDTSFSEAA